jgi:hypothetical protein
VRSTVRVQTSLNFGGGAPALADGRIFVVGNGFSSVASSVEAFSAVDGSLART